LKWNCADAETSLNDLVGSSALCLGSTRDRQYGVLSTTIWSATTWWSWEA